MAKMFNIVESSLDTGRLTDPYTQPWKGLSNDKANLGDAWNSLKSSGEALFSKDSVSEPEAYLAVAVAAGNAATDIVKTRLDATWKDYFSPQTVTVGELVGVGASASTYTWSEVGGYALGRLRAVAVDLSNVLEDIGKTVMDDPRVRDSIMSLSEVQAATKVITSTLRVYTSIKNIVDRFEPYFPYLEIAADAALIFWSGGATFPKMSAEAAMAAAKELSKMLPLIINELKNYVFGMEIRVPKILLGELRRLATATEKAEQMLTGWEAELAAKHKWLSYISRDSYLAVTAELRNPNRPDGWRSSLRSIATDIVGRGFVDNLVSSTRRGSELLYKARLDYRDYWVAAVRYSSTEGTVSSSPMASVIALTQDDVASISKELYEAADSEADYYANRQLHLMIVEELQKDGALVSIERRTYDEAGTTAGGSGDRKFFTQLNYRITVYHKLLKALKGETRADIAETIPVIDFYRKEFTGLLYRYNSENPNASDRRFETIERIVPEAPNDPTAPSEADLSNPDSRVDAKRSLLNLALSSYDMALPFYNTTSAISVDNNLLVDWSGADEPRASGLLNGLFTSVGDVSVDGSATAVSRWRWYDDVASDHVERAERIGVPLTRGARYSEAHLVDRGTVVPYPLLTTDPRWGGKAEEIYRELSNLTQDQIVYKYRNEDLADWRASGGTLHMVTTLSHGVIHEWEEVETYTVKESVTSTWPFRWLKKTVERQRIIPKKYAAARYPEKVYYYAEAEDRFLATLWTSLLQEEGGVDWLVLNADSDPRVLASKDPFFVPSLFRSFSASRTSADKSALQAAAKETLVKASIATVDHTVTHVTVLSPLEVLYNSEGILPGMYYPRTALFIPDKFRSYLEERGVTSDKQYFPQTMYLVANYDLKLSADDMPHKLCTFVHDSAVLLCEVASVDYVNLDVANVRVVLNGETYLSNGSTTVTQAGGGCYFYKLTCLALTYEGTPIDVYPLKGGVVPLYASTSVRGQLVKTSSTTPFLSGAWESLPTAFEEESSISGYALVNLSSSVATMRGMAIVAGVPYLPTGPVSNYSTYKINAAPGTSLQQFGKLVTDQSEIGKEYIQGTIMGIPIIEKELPDTTRADLPLRELTNLLAPWLDAEEAVALIASENVITSDEKAQILSMIASFRTLYNTIRTIFANGNILTLDQCLALDRILGNSAPHPWLSVGEGAGYTVSINTLKTIASYLYSSLEGDPSEGPYPVRCLPGDRSPVGRNSSLYYQRYLFLNNRMHKTRGHLAKAASHINSWKIARDQQLADRERLNAYLPSIEAASVVMDDDIVYIEANTQARGYISADGKWHTTTEDQVVGGKFYSRSVLDAVRGGIGDQCLLVCRACPVKNDCPFYDEDSLILGLIPALDTFDLWFKDNELDLLVYEDGDKLDLFTTNEAGEHLSRIDASVIKNRHKAFVEIVHDPDKDYNLQNLRDRLSARIPGYLTAGEYAEDFAWLQGGRYGTIDLHASGDPARHSYLYDALFIDDEITAFRYQPTQTRYPVTVAVQEGGTGSAVTTYSGSVRIKVPVALKIFDDISPKSEVYLVSDDPRGSSQPYSIVYLNTVEKLTFAFDMREDGAEDELESAEDAFGPKAKDIAQWSVNYYKEFSSEADQWWMPTITKRLASGGSVDQPQIITVPGRPRRATVVDALTTSQFSAENALRGKPVANVHNEFLRKVSFNLSSFLWVKNGSLAEIERVKKQLPAMKTNVRLVVVKK